MFRFFCVRSPSPKLSYRDRETTSVFKIHPSTQSTPAPAPPGFSGSQLNAGFCHSCSVRSISSQPIIPCSACAETQPCFPAKRQSSMLGVYFQENKPDLERHLLPIMSPSVPPRQAETAAVQQASRGYLGPGCKAQRNLGIQNSQAASLGRPLQEDLLYNQILGTAFSKLKPVFASSCNRHIVSFGLRLKLSSAPGRSGPWVLRQMSNPNLNLI